VLAELEHYERQLEHRQPSHTSHLL
jgi:hypothetical protein